MDPASNQQWKSRMGDLAFGTALHAAARDYKKELKAQEKAAQAQRREAAVDMDKLADDPELEKLHADRLAAMKKEAEKRAVMQRKGHGEYRQIAEPEFLEEVTGSPLVICHFFHKEFSRCKIIDKHLSILCTRYFGTKFIKLDVELAPFFVTKLSIKVLPCVVMFRDGVAFDRIVGFEELGGKDDFPTEVIEQRFLRAGVVVAPPPRHHSDDEGEGGHRRAIYSGRRQLDSDDESSDFDD